MVRYSCYIHWAGVQLFAGMRCWVEWVKSMVQQPSCKGLKHQKQQKQHLVRFAKRGKVSILVPSKRGTSPFRMLKIPIVGIHGETLDATLSWIGYPGIERGAK